MRITEQTWRRATTWAAVLVSILALIILIDRLGWLLKPALGVITPFLIGFLLAYLLNPLITKLENRGVPRPRAVILVSLLFLAVFAGIIVYLVPKAVEQGIELAQDLPRYAHSLAATANDYLAKERPLLERFNLPTSVSAAFNQFSDQIKSFTTAGLGAISGFIAGLLGKMIWVVIVPLVTIYFLNEWHYISRRLKYMIPESRQARVLPLLEAVSNVFNSYIRGQLILSSLYAVVTAIILGVFFKLNYSLIIALVAGLVSPIPYIGSFIILATTTIVAFAQHPNWLYVVGVAVAMMVQNNVLFDNIIGPRVLGRAVGLNAFWSLLALMLGGTLFGIVGMLLAVPSGAVIKVFLCSYYPKLCADLPEEPGGYGRARVDKALTDEQDTGTEDTPA